MVELIKKRYEQLSEIDNFKQLNEDLDTGKSLIIDYKDNSIECDKFGIPTIKYYKNITGQKSYKSRLSKGLIKELKLDPIQYIPNTSHLVGSPMCPRPISIPFYNQISKSQDLIKTIKKKEIYNLLKNKKLFDLKNSKKDRKSLPSYFCVKLGADSPKTRNHLINLLNEKIENIKKEKNTQKYYSDKRNLKGLINYKELFKKNLTKDVFNGIKIPFTNQKDIKLKFKITNQLIKKEGWNKMHIERQNINYDEYKKLYRIKRVGDENNILKKHFSYINSFEISKNEENDLIRQNNNNCNNFKKMPLPIKINFDKNRKLLNALISPRNEEKKSFFRDAKIKSRQKKIYELKNKYKYSSFRSSKSEKRLNSAFSPGYALNDETKMQNNIISKKREIYSPRIFHNFKKISLSIFNSEDINNDKNINSENMKKINISYSQKIYNKNRIKKLNEIRKKFERENRLIKGYESQPEPEELNEDDGFKKRPPKFVSPIDVYKKEIELIKKVNPIEYQRQLNKKLFYDKMLMKRLENKKIFERIRNLKNKQ